MALTIKSDSSRPGGGYAILRVDGGAPSSLAIEDRSSGLYLAPGGKWTKQPNYFDVEASGETFARLGPEIVDHVEADSILALHAPGGRSLGILVWPAIRPSAGASGGDVIAPVPAPAAAAIAGEIPAPPDKAVAAAAVAAVAEAVTRPLPPPPQLTATRPTPAPSAAAGLSLRSGFLIANVVALSIVALLVALFLFRGTDTAKDLVCGPGGALHGVGLARLLAMCSETPTTNPEELAYKDYLQCLPGKAACAQIACGDTYLSGFASGAHSAQVRAANSQSEKSCWPETQKKTDADTFAAFSDCLRITINICNQSQCVDRYRYKLTAEPYASTVRQAAETAANACRRQQEDSAFDAFNRCVAGAEACDTARCASAFTSAFPTSAYVSRVLQTAENAARTCATPPAPPQTPAPAPTPQPTSPEQAARNFIDWFYYTHSSEGEAAGARLNTIYAPQVNFYGGLKSMGEILNEKFKINAKWDTRRFFLSNDTISVSCNSTGQVCRATGQVQFDFASSSLGSSSRGVSSFDLLIANPENNPKVIGEASKVERRY